MKNFSKYSTHYWSGTTGKRQGMFLFLFGEIELLDAEEEIIRTWNVCQCGVHFPDVRKLIDD